MNTNIIEVLWTGGSDSTFRILQLSRLPIIIQPYYIPDGRGIQEIEISTIQKITELIRQKKESIAELRPIHIIPIDKKDIQPDIAKAYDNIREYHPLGAQYKHLATFAIDHPGIELSIHNEAALFIQEYAKLQKIENDSIRGGVLYH